MHIRLLKKIGSVLLLCLILTGCSWFGGNTTVSKQTTLPATVESTVDLPSQGIDLIAQQVLTNMHLHAWNKASMNHGVVTGGLFINWEMNNPANTNAVQPGPDGDTQHNHDPQVDLFYLLSLAEYRYLHPQDHSFDGDITQATTLVLTDFRTYSLPKGWIYFGLLRSSTLLHNNDLLNEAQGVASRLFTRWYDPALGFVYDRAHTPGDYSTNLSLQSGAALIEAGQRWNHPDWVTAGEKTIDHIISVGRDPTYGLFYNSMIVATNGQDTVQNYQIKPSTQGESVEALVTAYNLTHKQAYLDTAREVLQNLFQKSGLWDQKRGGFYFALDLKKDKLLTSYKETRSSTLVLDALNLYNRAQQQAMSAQEQQLIAVLTGGFYQSTYHGYFYRVTPDFQVYTSRPGSGIGVEDYFTTEAMGSALDALQQTEL